MAIVHNWISKQLLHTQYLGDVTGDELVGGALEVSGDPRFDDLRYIIGDWSGATGSTVAAEDVEALAACVKAMALTNPHVHNVSIMYGDDEARQALVSFYAMLTEDISWTVEAYHSLAEANEALGLNLAAA